MKITRTNQCKLCPWRKDVDPKDIPNYRQEMHENLRDTIADGTGSLMLGTKIMTCHEHAPGQEAPCVGWLLNQAGPGNNIAVRLALAHSKVPLVVHGPQHARFEDTLPKKGRRRR